MVSCSTVLRIAELRGFVFLTKLYYEGRWDWLGHVARMKKKSYVCRLLVGRHERKKPLGITMG